MYTCIQGVGLDGTDWTCTVDTYSSKYILICIPVFRVLDWMGQTGPGQGAQVHEDNGVKFESILR